MAKRKIDETGDSDDLQSLFDNIAAGGGDAPAPVAAVSAPAAPAVQVKARAPASGGHDDDDNDELQALFDAEAVRYIEPAGGTGAAEDEDGDSDTAVFNRIGKMTRKLHDMLIELGLDSKLQEVADSIPDTRQRLSYVAQMTEKAASRVLAATEIAGPAATKIESGAEALRARWDKVFNNQLSVEEFKALAGETHGFLDASIVGSRVLNAQLHEIMMAQDFQDLTGQVIKKVVEMAQALESQLLGLLIDSAPEELRTDKSDSLLNGPVINSEGRDDVVTSQEQVDDLLASLGF